MVGIVTTTEGTFPQYGQYIQIYFSQLRNSDFVLNGCRVKLVPNRLWLTPVRVLASYNCRIHPKKYAFFTKTTKDERNTSY